MHCIVYQDNFLKLMVIFTVKSKQIFYAVLPLTKMELLLDMISSYQFPNFFQSFSYFILQIYYEVLIQLSC
ncbi:hypothetical protein VNO80_14812 [Phaseolus coccineus]|uniref:Uncharacterized protein n=1 Tax=Phaseolus coccineus TaxID=3886 RepID=A0AAN9MMH5_PHACN